MSYKLSLILSLVFLSAFFVFGVDMLCLQYAYSDLDSKSTAISYQISKNGVLDDEFVSYITSTFKVDFICLSNCTPLFGDTVEYVISQEYNPLIISNEPMILSVKRTTVIGFFG